MYYSFKVLRMIQRQSLFNALTLTPSMCLVLQSTYTQPHNNSVQTNWIFTILKLYLHHLKTITDSTCRPLLCSFVSSSSNKLYIDPKIAKLLQFQNSTFLTIFNGSCSTMVKMSIWVVNVMHDGQDLISPLHPHHGMVRFFSPSL